ncbi:hypothetical protein BC497_29450 (plasmid) [Klebsiella variicola]|nr:hypothetical protein BC497_29450 [Klebsiella variicola]
MGHVRTKVHMQRIAKLPEGAGQVRRRQGSTQSVQPGTGRVKAAACRPFAYFLRITLIKPVMAVMREAIARMIAR